MTSYWYAFDVIATCIAKLVAVYLAAACVAGTASAGEHRELAGFSTEFRQIAQGRPGRIIVAGLDDIPLGTWSGVGDIRGTSQHCVGTNVGGRQFGIVVTGSGAGGAFVLSNGITNLPFRVRYNDGTGGTTVRPGTLISNLTGRRLRQCRRIAQQPMRIRVRIRERDLQAATPGSYSGSLTLTVTPE